jgi:hypothetical protein
LFRNPTGDGGPDALGLVGWVCIVEFLDVVPGPLRVLRTNVQRQRPGLPGVIDALLCVVKLGLVNDALVFEHVGPTAGRRPEVQRRGSGFDEIAERGHLRLIFCDGAGRGSAALPFRDIDS